MAANRNKSTRRHKDKVKSPLPFWVWLLCAAAAGFAFAKIIPFATHRDWSQTLPHVSLQPNSRPFQAARTPTPKKTVSHFDFYKMLPKFRVTVPHQNKTTTPHAVKDRKAKDATTSPGVYVLQAGSFKDYADADRLRAHLALLGVESNVQKIQTHSGQTWNRVRIGPIKNLKRLDKIRAQLRRKNIEPMVMRIHADHH